MPRKVLDGRNCSTNSDILHSSIESYDTRITVLITPANVLCTIKTHKIPTFFQTRCPREVSRLLEDHGAILLSHDTTQVDAHKQARLPQCARCVAPTNCTNLCFWAESIPASPSALSLSLSNYQICFKSTLTTSLFARSFEKHLLVLRV